VISSSTFTSSDGDGYELQMGRWSRRLAPLFLGFTGTAGALRVLDVGCGTGCLSSTLGCDPEIISMRGVDISAAYIHCAKRRNTDRRFHFQVADACALPFADASFDHSLSMLALQFVSRPCLALREMRRVTRRGGTVAAATWDTRGGFVALRMIYDTAAVLHRSALQARAAAYTRPLSVPGELVRLWKEAGLTHVVDGALTIRMDFASFVDFWAPVEGTEGPIADYVRSLDADARLALREMVRLAYVDGAPDGARSYAATAWVVKGCVS
jgi:SAM-dependent methyltransferase